MFKSNFICILLCLLLSVEGFSQSSATTSYSNTSYHHPSTEKLSWQRLLLQLSSMYIFTAKEGQVDIDSCLLNASHSLGLSRYSVLAEGMDDPELQAQSNWIDQGEAEKGVRFLSQAKGKKHLELLVLLGAYYAFQPRSYYHVRDSIELFLIPAIKESRTLNEEQLGRQATCLLAKMFIQSNNSRLGDSLFNQLISECDRAGDNPTKARALAYRATYSPLSPVAVSNKISDLQKAIDIYHSLNDREGEIYALTGIGYLRIILSELQESYNAFLKALQLGEAIHFPYIHYTTDALAMVTVFEGKFGEPLKYTMQSIKIAENNRDSIGWAYFYSRMSALYRSEGGKEKEVIKWLHKTLDRFLVDRNPDLYFVLNEIVNHLNEEGRGREAINLIFDISKKIPPANFTNQFFYNAALSTSYIHLKQYELAELYLLKADSSEAKAESYRGPLRRGWTFSQYGFIFYNQARYREARSKFEKYLVFNSLRIGTLESYLNTYRKLIEIDSILHDPAAGLAHYKKYAAILDSSFRVSKIRQAEELQVMYQTEDKEDQIALLNKESKLEQANVKQATLTRNITIAAIVIVLVFSGLLYRQSRQRKRNNDVITRQNEQLQHFLTEKEWLLKEIHHRVKNNLQIVMSLLSSQSEFIENESALTAIHDSEHRVHAMSLIHQKLYNSENVSSIDMSYYIQELVTYLSDSFNTGQRIRFEFSLEPIEMDVSQAVPLGLILNEAITNAIKYAFPDGRKGIISILLSQTTSGQCVLSISDNGIGIPKALKNKKTGSLGMSLMEGLTEDLDGKISYENKQGATIKISFKYVPGVNRQDSLVESISLNN